MSRLSREMKEDREDLVKCALYAYMLGMMREHYRLDTPDSIRWIHAHRHRFWRGRTGP